MRVLEVVARMLRESRTESEAYLLPTPLERELSSMSGDSDCCRRREGLHHAFVHA